MVTVGDLFSFNSKIDQHIGLNQVIDLIDGYFTGELFSILIEGEAFRLPNPTRTVMHVHPNIILRSFDLLGEVNFKLNIHHGIENDMNIPFYCLLLLLACECFCLFRVYGKLFVDDTVCS